MGSEGGGCVNGNNIDEFCGGGPVTKTYHIQLIVF